ncbi:DEAD/DEAH box helicase [Balneolaceae bacterium YR4-1]|uniref:DEAD/DEAH box helicase n=1 Tax=Halalkalibaculum roseum TaxID=2709311 RepID=A0A6M1T4T4_9BACT|nr:DEAD/DEAH box helicase [Halalkalibaculum roseum]NGP77797.1 DEAD/DEAH box helicase [Halalkalibaculum roseum]
MKFDELNLNPSVLKGLNDLGNTNPTSLQETIIPAFLDGKNAFVKAGDIQGKVEVISITTVDTISKNKDEKGTLVLVLTPNPKGAHHIVGQISELAKHEEVTTATIDMDGDREAQEKAVLNGTSVLVANPGRLLDIMEDNLFILRNVKFLVIDGLDEMIDIGLEEQLKKIKKRVMSESQKLLFTNELNNNVKSLADNFLESPALIGFENLGSNGQTLQGPPEVSKDLSQGYINVPSRMKITTLMAHIEKTPADKCVIFTASKRGTDRLYRIFRKNNMKVTSLHGKLSDEKRSQRFANFANGDVQFLLVSDISASELNLDKVTQVINYDVPNDPDEYKYRANLVGAGKASRIVSLVSKQDQSDIRELKNEIGQSPEELPLPEKVVEKLEERKKKGKKQKRDSRPKRGSKGKKEKKERSKNKMELPRPSYEKLSGGRTGEADERTGVVEFFRKLFS